MRNPLPFRCRLRTACRLRRPAGSPASRAATKAERLPSVLHRFATAAACVAAVALMASAGLRQDILHEEAEGYPPVDGFGQAVALATGQDTILVGAPRGAGDNVGRAFVFTAAPGGGWSQRAMLPPPHAAAGYLFGSDVAVESDVAAVGSVYATEAGVASGAVYVYSPSGGGWSLESTLTPSDARQNDYFGGSVAISGDTILVGAEGHDDPVQMWLTSMGAAYVFTRAGDGWTQQARLTASDADGGDGFGRAVALEGDTAVVGAPYAAARVQGYENGLAYVFTRADGVWTEEARLTGPDQGDGVLFGSSVALNGDTVVIGAPGSNSAFVFTRSGGTWTRQTNLASQAGPGASGMGYRVALDGDIALLTGLRTGWSSSRTFVFTRSGGAWTRQQDRTGFGESLALRGDMAVIGGSVRSALVLAGLVSSNPDGLPRVQATPLPDAVAHRPYATALVESGGTGPWAWRTVAGSLPEGIALDPGSGAIAGTPAQSGLFQAWVRAADALGVDSDEAPVTLRVVPLANLAKREIRARADSVFGGDEIFMALELLRGTTVSGMTRDFVPVIGCCGVDFLTTAVTDITPGALRILDASGTPLDLAGYLEAWEHGWRLLDFPVPESGRYFLQVRPQGGMAVEATLSVAPPARSSGEGPASGVDTIDTTLSTLPGARVVLRVEAARGSEAIPTVLSVRDESGNELIVPAELRERKRFAVLRMKAPVPGGNLVVRFGTRKGSAGGIRWSARIREPSGYGFSLPDLPAGPQGE